MTTWMEEMGLRAEGFNDAEIAEIDGARDDLMHIWATYLALKPRLDRVGPVILMVLQRLDANQKAGQI